MKRHLIKHPVVCDSDMEIWKCLEIICWPTLLVINPNGLIIAEFKGENQANYINKFLSSCFKFYSNQLSATKVKFSKIQIKDENNLKDLNSLCFPTKLCIDNQKSILFISDSGNNRILAVDLKTNEIKFSIGSSKCGLLNSDLNESEFNWPQGLVKDPKSDLLYIADTFNNVIRVADLETKKVSTLCGVYDSDSLGEYDYKGGLNGKKQKISSPWDLCLIEKENSKILLIACAGSHQIWLYSFENKFILTKYESENLLWWRGIKIDWDILLCVAGNGKERNKNNSYPMQCSFAQPSGICFNESNDLFYIADAESSTIRSMSIKDGAVKNVAGGDNLQPDNLFAYGDSDGKGSQARIQHPIDVKVLSNDILIVTDTYNNSLKKIDLKNNFCSKIYLNGPKLNEPNSVFVNGDEVFVADTNNHSIKVVKNFNIDINQADLHEFEIKFNKNTDLTKEPKKDKTKTLMLVKFDGHINFDAPNKWKLDINFNDGGKAEFSGKLNNLFRKNDSNDNDKLFELEPLKEELNKICGIEIFLSFVNCIDQSCRLESRKLKYDFKQLSKMAKKIENCDAIIIEIV